jgi:hypothetical protein
MSNDKFKCRYCGDMFTLLEEEQELLEEGVFIDTPDTCDFCAYNVDHAPVIEADYPSYSDADPGL